MSQEVSLRGTGRAIFAGILLIIGGVLWLPASSTEAPISKARTP